MPIALEVMETGVLKDKHNMRLGQLHLLVEVLLKALKGRAGKSTEMSERGLFLGVKCPQSCVE